MATTNPEFSVSKRPVVAGRETEPRPTTTRAELPRSYGSPLLFAIARDPRSIFVYWDFDWPAIFASLTPHQRKVFLRAHSADGALESEREVEPLAGNCYVTVEKPRAVYHVELGYFQPEQVWNAVAKSNEVTMPADAPSEVAPIDITTVPFHLSFQRMIDVLRDSRESDAPLTDMLAELRERSENAEVAFSAAEEELFRAMQRDFAELNSWQDRDAAALEQRLERILGFGPTSPAHGFGGSSR